MVLCSLCLCAVTESKEADAAGIVFSCSVHSHRGHNSRASSNEEGGIDLSCDDYELDDYFPTGSQSCSHPHSSYESREDRERECCKVSIVILSSSDPTE